MRSSSAMGPGRYAVCSPLLHARIFPVTFTVSSCGRRPSSSRDSISRSRSMTTRAGSRAGSASMLPSLTGSPGRAGCWCGEMIWSAWRFASTVRPPRDGGWSSGSGRPTKARWTRTSPGRPSRASRGSYLTSWPTTKSAFRRASKPVESRSSRRGTACRSTRQLWEGRRRGGGRQALSTPSLRISRTAWWAGSPLTPPPAWVADDAWYNPRIGVR